MGFIEDWFGKDDMDRENESVPDPQDIIPFADKVCGYFVVRGFSVSSNAGWTLFSDEDAPSRNLENIEAFVSLAKALALDQKIYVGYNDECDNVVAMFLDKKGVEYRFTMHIDDVLAKITEVSK